MSAPTDESRVRTGPARVAWMGVGFLAVGLGGIGVVVPGLPTTGFFVLAASCFARSSPRFERWVLGLPTVGPMVADYRAGLGMPRRAKLLAISMITIAVTISAGFAMGGAPAWVRASVVVAGVIGVAYVGWRVPTRERVLEARGAARRT
ncbi:MAG: YbaN family protein [Actinomycetota bacterium]|nr:YbaN family protein [Actinomycetota bacterium]